jgi:hypothetical protein
VKTSSKILAIVLLSILVSSTFAFLTYAQPALADIMLTVTPNKTKVVSGTSVAYLYNVTNTGELPLTGNITDATFGPVGIFVNLQPNGWVGFNITHVITQNTTNLATAYGFDQYGRLVTDSVSTFVQVYVPSADIELTVTPKTTKVVSGTPVSYLYNVTNTGEVPLTGAIYDDVFGPVGNFVNLAPNGWVGYNITHTITQNTSNTAIAWGVDQYSRNVTDSASAFVQVYVPSSDIVLTVTPKATKVVSGTPVAYLYNVTNTGETPLTGAIYDDVFGPVGNFVNLQPNGWVGYNITHVITQNTTNIATAYGIDQYGHNVTDSVLTFVQVYSGADIKLTVTPSKTKVVSGTPVSYLYNVTNTGETALTGAIYDYTFGSVGNFVNLQPNGWVGYNITHTITQNTTSNAVAYGINQFGSNVTDTASAFVQVYSGADISLTVTPSATKVMIGTSVSYLYNVTNTGELPLTGAIYDDVFGPVGNFVNLQPGGWVGYNITHVLTQNTSNTATAYGVSQSGVNVTSSASVFVEVFKIPNVIPEVPIGPVVAAVAMFLAFGVYKIKPRARNKRQILQAQNVHT